MKIALAGATGKMGAALLGLLRGGGDRVVGATAAPGCPQIGLDLGEAHGLAPLGVLVQDDPASALLGADVAIDFSHASAVADLARAAARAGVPIVSGTTGLGPDAHAALDAAAKKVPVLWAPNFSLGIQVLAELVRLALQRLGPGFDVEIVETHHRGKVDAPSGTAERLASEVRAVRGQMKRTHGREGMVGARASDELAVLSIRGGDVVGDHSVHLFGQGERIELTHRATSRVLFARGALVGARWILGKPPGRHGVSDVVGGGA